MTRLGESAAVLDEIPGVSHRFFSRRGGTSPMPWRGLNTSFTVGDVIARVEENLARVRFQIGVGRHALFTARQVHGRDVVIVTADDDATEVSGRAADALVTASPGIAVGVRTADCAPILFSSTDGAVIGAAHAGWRGAVGGVLEATLDAFAALGRAPADVVAVVGPTIGQDAFEVGPEVIEAARAVVPVGELVRAGRDDRAHLDLAGFVARVLEARGVGRVAQVRRCTFSDEEYFSHRRDHGQTGRQLSVIARVAPPRIEPETFG